MVAQALNVASHDFHIWFSLSLWILFFFCLLHPSLEQEETLNILFHNHIRSLVYGEEDDPKP